MEKSLAHLHVAIQPPLNFDEMEAAVYNHLGAMAKLGFKLPGPTPTPCKRKARNNLKGGVQ